VRAYRLVKHKHVAEVLRGVGASFRLGARWNLPGDRAVYAAENRALAIVETLAHVPLLAGLPAHVMCEIDIPDALVERPRNPPSPHDAEAAVLFGHSWFVEARSLALAVPSVVVPQEANIVINAAHSDAAYLTVIGKEPYAIDERLAALFARR
jgi:RES domain-containing protein